MNPRRRRCITGLLGGAAAIAAAGSPVARSSTARRGAPDVPAAVDVAIIGAGLSGLYAALLLEERGFTVQVLEARAQPGGRLRTLDDLFGKPDVGGVTVGANYARFISLCRRFALPLIAERPRSSPQAGRTALVADDRIVQWEDWERSPHNPLPAEYRRHRPHEFPWVLQSSLNPLRALQDWQSPAMAAGDRPAGAWFAAQGFDPAARQLIDATLGYGNRLSQLSTLHLMHVWRFVEAMAAVDQGRTYAVAGGMQRLPEAMAAALRRPLAYEFDVRSLRNHRASGVELGAADGRSLQARVVLATAPAIALRRVRIELPLPVPLRRAIDTMSYHAVTLLYFEATRRFWEHDGLPPGLWGDHQAERFMPQPYLADGEVDLQASPRLFLAYVNGARAQALDRLPERLAVQRVLDDLARLRPGTRGALEPLRVVSWQRDPFAGGAYASWAPGECAALAPAWAETGGPLVFAGEHTAVVSRGMEGALESAERAVVQVVSAMA